MELKKNREKQFEHASVKLQDIINLEFLQEFQDNFAQSLGVASITVDIAGNPVTQPSNFTDFCMKYTRGSKEGLGAAWIATVSAGKNRRKPGNLPYTSAMPDWLISPLPLCWKAGKSVPFWADKC